MFIFQKPSDTNVSQAPLRHCPRISRRATLPTTLLLVRRRANTTREERIVHGRSTAWGKPLGARRYSGVAHSHLNRHRILLERVQTTDRRSDARGARHCRMGLLACHLLPWHVGRLPWTLRRKGHQEIGFDLNGLLRLQVRRYRSQYRGRMPPACSSSMA